MKAYSWRTIGGAATKAPLKAPIEDPRLIDDAGVIDFVDDAGVESFIDDAGKILG